MHRGAAEACAFLPRRVINASNVIRTFAWLLLLLQRYVTYHSRRRAHPRLRGHLAASSVFVPVVVLHSKGQWRRRTIWIIAHWHLLLQGRRLRVVPTVDEMAELTSECCRRSRCLERASLHAGSHARVRPHGWTSRSPSHLRGRRDHRARCRTRGEPL